MGMAQVTAARIYKGNARDGRLALDDFPHTAFVRTYAADAMVTDSAASATAMATGFKTNNRMISVAPDGARLPTLLEAAKKSGKSVGIVTTTRVTHATPAAFYAHVADRDDELHIAAQLIDESRVDLILGGGRGSFLPSTVTDAEFSTPGLREDGRNLIELAVSKGYLLLERQTDVDALMAAVDADEAVLPLLGLFNPSHMAYEAERMADPWGEPSLASMTRIAIEVLSRNPKGYFLMVEGGRIDHACHSNQARLALEDLLAFDEAAAEGLRAAESVDGPIVVVTADHETGGLALNGYPEIGVSGDALMTLGSDAGPDILTFATGPGARRLPGSSASPAGLDSTQASLNHLDSAAHTGVDVGLWAAGPGSEAFDGTLDNTDVGRLLFQNLAPD
jgi:alkaline phosphatase